MLNQTEEDKYQMTSHVESYKYNKLMNKTKKQTQVMENKLVVSSGERKAGERHYRGRGLRRRGYYGII